MNLMNAYTENRRLCREMKRIVEEELEHFEMVLEILDQRGVTFRRIASGPYGKQLTQLIRQDEPHRGVDRLLGASLIQARSCERFRILSEEINDEDLRDFYRSLMESEARHYTTFLNFARKYGKNIDVEKRWQEFLDFEATLMEKYGKNETMHGQYYRAMIILTDLISFSFVLN